MLKKLFYKNRAWFFLFTITLAFTGYLTIAATCYLYKYYSLNQSIKPEKIQWKITKDKNLKYQIYANYQYNINDKIFKNEDHLKRIYPNKYVAVSYINDLKKDLKIFYNSRNPKKASLVHSFPINCCFRAFISICVLIYFYYLKRYWQKHLY
jgi:hypothetical protein